MSKKWAYIIIFTVIVVAVISGWEIYAATSDKTDVTNYKKYVTEISTDLDGGQLQKVYKKKDLFLVTEDQINPPQAQ